MRLAAIVLLPFVVALPCAAQDVVSGFSRTPVRLTADTTPQAPVPAFAYVGRPVEDNVISIEGRPALEPQLFALVATRQGQPLSIADVRQTITHFYSLGRFDDVQVEAEHSPNGGVHVRYLLQPVHAVYAVRFRRPLGLPESMLRERMAERFGETPAVGRAADVAAALEDLYREAGYLEADVRAAPPIVEHNPDRTTLVFDVNPGGRARISRTNIVGDPIEPQAELIGRLGVQPGQPYQPADIRRKLAEHVQRLRHRGYYQASATVESAAISPDRMQADLTIAVRPGPLVTVRYEGDPIPRERLTEFVPIEREGSVDEDLLEDAKNRITAYLTQQGYWRATVTHTERAGPGTLAIVFHITRGPQYHVGPEGVEVSGNASMPIEEFRPALRTLAPGDPFDAAKLDAIVGAITRVYQTRGFATMKAQSAVIETQPGLVRPVITIAEGPRVVVGTVSIEGNTHIKAEELLARVTSKTGAPYYGPTVASDRDAILVEYLNAGYSAANVTITPRVSPDGTRADLPFTVVEGPQTIVDHIIVVGNTRTDESVIRRELQLHEGKPLGLQDLIESRTRLSALGLFRRVRITPLEHGNSGDHDVLVTVEEAMRTTIGYGGGAEINRLLEADPVTGEARENVEFAPRGFFEIGRRNIGGRNRTANLYTRLSLRPNRDRANPKTFGFAEYRIVGTYRQPRPFRGAGDFTVTAAVEQGVRSSFNFSRKGANVEVARRLSNVIRGSARYSFTTTRIFDVQPTDPEDASFIQRLFPQVRVSAFSVALARDTRDDVVDPQGGTFVTADGTIAARILGSEVGFNKAFLTGFWYRNLGHPHLVFATGLRLGLASPFARRSPADLIQQVPASERFFAGGDTTIRGFALDSVAVPALISANGFPIGGDAVIILNGELRAPVWRDLAGALFIDGGNVFPRPSDIDLHELRGSVGFGLRYRSPLGPIRVDLGFKLNRRVIVDRLEPRTALHFSIGQAF
jgi:outer membrane protein assembly factor BamA